MSENALTLGGFIALITLLIGVAALVASMIGRTARLGERVATLEAKVAAHVENGMRHRSDG